MRTATAATAAPAPAPAPRTHAGGEPVRNSAAEAQDREQAREDEPQPPHQRPRRTAHAPRAEDRELRGGRAGEQVARGDRVLELPVA